MARLTRYRRALAGGLAVGVLLVASVLPVAAGGDHVVQRGDTLWDIARRYGLTVSELVALNHIANPSLIRVGQRIVLEAPAPTTTPASAPKPPSAAPAVTIHVVRTGDTLWDIAQRYGTSVGALVTLNKIANASLIRPGQALAIPSAAAASPAPAAAATTPSPAPPAQPAPIIHVVQRGETLSGIATHYRTTVAALVELNGIANPSLIRTGQRIRIPGAAAAPASDTSRMTPEMAAKVGQRTAARDLLLAAAREFRVPGAFMLAVAWQESGWQQGAVSHAGAVGLMQLMPSTADWVAGSMLGEAPNIRDAAWNARAGARLLAYYLARYDGDKTRVLAAYLQGMTSVDQRGVLESSVRYINTILALERMFGG